MRRPEEMLLALPDIISGMKKGMISRQHATDLATICIATAEAIVRRQIVQNSWTQQYIGLSLHDIAIDCVADLFVSDEFGMPIKIRQYFNDIETGDLSPQAVLVQLRSLVSSSVTNGLFRIYGEIDPALSKIIRNIKLQLQESKLLEIITRFGEPYIALRSRDLNLQCAEAQLEDLEKEFSLHSIRSSRIPDLLRCLAETLAAIDKWQRVVGLTKAAQIFRNFYVRDQQEEELVQADASTLDQDNLRRIVRDACRVVQKEVKRSYVDKQKITEDQFQTYFETIEVYLLRILINRQQDNDSLFEVISEREPNLSKEEYDRNHRKIVEYLSRKCKNACLELLKS